MKVLILADEEQKGLWDHYVPEALSGIDLIISCGDLDAAYLEFLVTMANRPLLYVPGNHDGKYEMHPPQGCISVDDNVVEIDGRRFAGLGGSVQYNNGPYQYSEREMERRIRRLNRRIARAGGIDVFITHAGVEGYGTLEDPAHRGFECFDAFLERWKPSHMFHGHVHRHYDFAWQRSYEHPSGTQIINGFGSHVVEL